MKKEKAVNIFLEEEKVSSFKSDQKEGILEWKCPSNIALVKYWGKKPNQIPQNPSISFTLEKSYTQLKIKYNFSPNLSNKITEFYFNGKKNLKFQKRIITYINEIKSFLPILNHVKLSINSSNSIPHSSGIASSASSFGALALALSDLEYTFHGKDKDEKFYQKVSFLARIGSGSACRSIYPCCSMWGEIPAMAYSSDFYAIPMKELIHPVFSTYRDCILIVSDEPKSISSSIGHDLMYTNPYAKVKYTESRNNLGTLLKILKNGDVEDFVTVVELEALSLHAMMMTGVPGYLLMKPQTLSIIEKIRNYRKRTYFPVCFTLDAGPNIHLLYPAEIENQIRQFIEQELLDLCNNRQVIFDLVGNGPEKLL